MLSSKSNWFNKSRSVVLTFVATVLLEVTNAPCGQFFSTSNIWANFSTDSTKLFNKLTVILPFKIGSLASLPPNLTLFEPT